MSQSTNFGTKPIGTLLWEQALPASVGMLIMSIYGIVDTIFVGRWVGSMGIAAITVVMPITFLISSLGMSIGVGGASVLSRALGEKNLAKASRTFGTQAFLAMGLALFFVTLGLIFIDEILISFGGKGDILQPAREYFQVILYGIPFLGWAMMTNNVIRAEGHPKVAMFTMIIPALVNLVLDPILIAGFGWGMEGAAWATTISYMASAGYSTWFFTFGKSGLQLKPHHFTPSWPLVKEIASIGSVTLARQGMVSILFIVLNNSLFVYGGEMAISVFGIINRVMMLVNVPALGITQGFLPIVGYNHGARLWDRVNKSIVVSMRSATGIAFSIFALIMIFTKPVVNIFTTDPELLAVTPSALRWTFMATPLLAINLIGSGYFQAVGKVYPALLLALTKQGFFLIPLILLLPPLLGLDGIWYAFPTADVGAAAITYWYMKRAVARRRRKEAATVPSSAAAKNG